MSVRTLSRFVFALFCTVMLGLAAGAVWMVAALYLRHPLPWLALPLGALLAACGTLLAALYVNLLIAGVLIAGNMGLGLVDSMHTAGLGLLWQLTRMALSPADLMWTGLGTLLAAGLAWRRSHGR
jgi:vitamin B12 transport system permease protein